MDLFGFDLVATLMGLITSFFGWLEEMIAGLLGVNDED